MKNNKALVIISILLLTFFIFLGQVQATIKTNKEQELKNMIGQMLIIGFRGTETTSDSYIIKEIKKNNIGGVILFDKDIPSAGKEKRNIENPNQTKKLISDIKKYSSSNIFVAIDAEGGYVNRLKEKYGFSNILSAEKIGQTNNINVAKTEAQKISLQLKNLGFNINFAPVVDVNVNPTNPVIGNLERSFSSDPFQVTNFAGKFIEGLHQQKIISAIKHFPGHGSSTTDSHLGMTDITNTYQAKEIIPYLNLIKNGYSDIIMTAHIMNRNIDPSYPATLSPKFVQNILRNGLNFKGVVISDDMQMGAIVDHYGLEDASIKAINAGCDMMIVSNNIKTYDEEVPTKIINAIYQAVKDKKIDEKRIYESYARIQKLKKTYSIK